MIQLSITITTIADIDYSGISISEKIAEATIDGIKISILHSEADTVDNTTVKTNYKAKLTSSGYLWDTEI